MISIYLYQNKLDNKIYIGQTNNFKRRHNFHSSGPGDKSSILDRAIRKYGIEHFQYFILEEWTTVEEANEAEEFWIGYFNSIRPNGYNILPGSTNVPRKAWNKGLKLTEEQKANMKGCRTGTTKTKWSDERKEAFREVAKKREAAKHKRT